jgi:hypothetical protein
MQKKVPVLLAVAGLLVFAFAAPRPDSLIRAMLRDGRHLDRDSIRALRAQLKPAVSPPGIDVNKVIQQVRSGRKPGPPSPLGEGPFAGHDEFMPAPTNGFRKGPNTATLDASKLASGVYFVKLGSETDTKTTKVIIE